MTTTSKEPTNGVGNAFKTTGGGRKIYMDNHATTPLDPRVLEAMLPYFTEHFGNASSRNHHYGWEAEEAVEIARAQIGALIGAESKEIVLTSGATESDNLAIHGAAEFHKEKGDHIITVQTEHKAVIDTCRYLESHGFRVTYLPVDKEGFVSLDQMREAITDKTILISVMFANNEVGTIQPIAEIGKLAREKGVLFHCDATQGVGKTTVDVESMNIDLLSMSAHKIYGPKGVGALYVRRRKPRVRLSPLIFGGGHERGLRSGTLNVPGAVGFGKACDLCAQELEPEIKRLTALRDGLKARLWKELDFVYLNGPESGSRRLAGNLNVSFAYVEGESLLMGLKTVAVSSGSACTSASLEPSYVLKALGVGEDLAHTSIRFGLGRFNTQAEVDTAAEEVIRNVKRLRDMSPLYEMAQEGIDLKTVKWASH